MLFERKEKRMQEVEVLVESKNLCDKCNCEIETEGHEVHECELTFRRGVAYPDNGEGFLSEMELCQKCSKELIELLKTNGYRINESEYDY